MKPKRISGTICAVLLACAGPARAQDGRAAEEEAARRAATIVRRMTTAEKLALVHGFFPPMAANGPADMVPSAGYVPAVPRLGIPALRESDASLGVANQIEQRKGDVATALPSGLALAATFDPALARRGGAMIGAEARAKTFNMLLAGGVNLTRDPWGGRNFEYLGEDPWLAGVMAGESIAGIQSNRIGSTIKHFAINSQETGRHIMDARIGEAALRESDLLAFQIAIERGRPASVMCAYNKINGEWGCENEFLLNTVLKRDWAYPGWVMSDWGAVHSSAQAAMKGLDQQSGQELDRAPYFGRLLAADLTAGRLSMARLDDMVRRIVTGMSAAGVLDHPVPKASQPIDYAANAKVAQEVAESGIVLLKNDRGLLPLARTAKRIVVIGAHADVGVLSGGGSSQVRSVGGAPVEWRFERGPAASFARVTWHASSPTAAIRALIPGADVRYVSGGDREAAVKAARDADAVVLFAWQWTTEAADVPDLRLPEGQDALVEAVTRANPRTTVVLTTGGPVLMPWLRQAGAVVQAWYPGQRGGEAIANILFGVVDPSGRLPITFPASADQAPRPAPPGLAEQEEADDRAARGEQNVQPAAFAVQYREGAAVGYRWYDRQQRTPMFAFGHGLSYTEFRYSDLQVDGFNVSFTVANTGKRAGADVPQVYIRAGRRDGPTLRLIGFEKVRLAPGESRRVSVTGDLRLVADYRPDQPGWHVAAGDYPIVVGRSAGDEQLRGITRLADIRLKP